MTEVNRRLTWYPEGLPRLVAKEAVTALEMADAGDRWAYQEVVEAAVHRAMLDLAGQQEMILEDFLASGAMLRDLVVEHTRPTLTRWNLMDAVRLEIDVNWRVI